MRRRNIRWQLPSKPGQFPVAVDEKGVRFDPQPPPPERLAELWSNPDYLLDEPEPARRRLRPVKLHWTARDREFLREAGIAID